MGVNIIDPITGNPLPVDGMRTIEDCKQLILEFCYPVGSFYISTKNVSPQTFLGGTWESRSGYMLRAATSDVTFDKANDTNDGGADSVTVTSVASHTHGSGKTGAMSANASHSHGVWLEYGAGGNASYPPFNGHTSNGYNQFGHFGPYTDKLQSTNVDHTHSIQSEGSNYTVNTLPKYKNVYMWERTA